MPGISTGPSTIQRHRPAGLKSSPPARTMRAFLRPETLHSTHQKPLAPCTPLGYYSSIAAHRSDPGPGISGRRNEMRKMDKVGAVLPMNWETVLRIENSPRADVTFSRSVDGKVVEFTVSYRSRAGKFPAKIIDIRDGLHRGPNFSYAQALKSVREVRAQAS